MHTLTHKPHLNLKNSSLPKRIDSSMELMKLSPTWRLSSKTCKLLKTLHLEMQDKPLPTPLTARELLSITVLSEMRLHSKTLLTTTSQRSLIPRMLREQLSKTLSLRNRLLSMPPRIANSSRSTSYMTPTINSISSSSSKPSLPPLLKPLARLDKDSLMPLTSRLTNSKPSVKSRELNLIQFARN